MVPKTIEYFALKISICLLRQPHFQEMGLIFN